MAEQGGAEAALHNPAIYLDDTDGDGLPHVPDGEPAEGRELGEGLDTHVLGGDQLHDGGVSGLDERALGGLAGTPVDLLKDLAANLQAM